MSLFDLRAAGFAVLLCPLCLTGAELTGSSTDKNQYHLFNPTPPERMRELSTDRPDQTESPHTVDAGHFQLEMDFVSAAFDRDDSGRADVRTESWPSRRST